MHKPLVAIAADGLRQVWGQTAVALVVGILLVAAGVSGCAGGKRSTVTTTTVTSSRPVEAPPSVGPEPARAAARQEDTTVTTTTTEREPAPGVVGSALGLAGAVIAFPFRVIGGVFGALF